jgi:hypothetical protein
MPSINVAALHRLRESYLSRAKYCRRFVASEHDDVRLGAMGEAHAYSTAARLLTNVIKRAEKANDKSV